MSDQFVPIEVIKRHIKEWWIITFLMIVGGLVGLIFSYFQPAFYDARAVFAVSIDYTRTGALSDIQEDQAMRNIGSILGSDCVIQKAIDFGIAQGLNINLLKFKERSYLEREDFRWFLCVRDVDPQLAMKLVNLWAQNADQVIRDASNHATRADELFKYLYSLESCLQRSSINNNIGVPCTIPGLPKILTEIQTTGEIAYQEKEASLGIMPALSVQLVELGQIPSEPVIFNRNLLVIAGALIGLVFAMLIMIIRGQKSPKEKIRGKKLI